MPSLTSIYLEHPPLGRARGRSPGARFDTASARDPHAGREKTRARASNLEHDVSSERRVGGAGGRPAPQMPQNRAHIRGPHELARPCDEQQALGAALSSSQRREDGEPRSVARVARRDALHRGYKPDGQDQCMERHEQPGASEPRRDVLAQGASARRPRRGQPRDEIGGALLARRRQSAQRRALGAQAVDLARADGTHDRPTTALEGA